MHTEVGEDVARVLMAMADGIFEPSGTPITNATELLAEDQANVARVKAFFTKSDFDALFPKMKQVNASAFTTYFDFMEAVRKTPSMCDGVVGPMYSQMSPDQMCAKELAGLLATAISATLPDGYDGTNGVTLCEDPQNSGTELSAEKCGLQITEDPDCANKDATMND